MPLPDKIDTLRHDDLQNSCVNLYAFYRLAHDGIGRDASPGEKQVHLKRCEEFLNRIYNHSRADFSHEIEPAFEQAVSRYEIPRQLFSDILTGLILETHFRPFQN